MPEHTKKHLTSSSPFRVSKGSAIELGTYFECNQGDLPKYAILLNGLRNREGLTQQELGQKIGVAQYHISRMERGKRSIGKNIAKRLEKVFKTDYRLFL